MTAGEVLAFISVAEEYKPVIKEGIKFIAGMGTEVAPVMENLRSFLVDGRIKSVRQYEAAGFTRKEAILLTIDGKLALNGMVESLNKASKKG